MLHTEISRRFIRRSMVIAAALAAAPVFGSTPVFVDNFNNGSVANSDTTPGFWSTLIDAAGTATEGSGAGGSLTLTATGATSGDQFPFTEIASPLQSSFNFFRAPIVIQASGLNYGANTNATSLTQFTLTTQALSNAGPNTEYPAQDAISLWVANPNNINGQILLGLKEDSPNASSAFDRFQALGPSGRDSFSDITYNGGQVRGFKLAISGKFYSLDVTHDASSTDSTQVTDSYNGGLDINRASSTSASGWGTLANPQGDNALNIETQLSGVSDPSQVAPFNVGNVTVSQLISSYLGPDLGNWSDGTNWSDADLQHPDDDGSTSNVPNFTGAAVTFGSTASPKTVIADADETLGQINFDSAQSYTLTVNGGGEGTIHLATRYLFSEINVLQGSHQILSPVEMHNDAVITVNQGTSTLTIPTLFAENPGSINLTKSGAGKLAVGNALFNTLSINGGTMQIMSNGTSAATSIVQTLNIAGTTDAWQGALDLTNNAAIVDYTATSPLTTIQNQLKNGYAHGAWTGLGINSSAAAANHTAHKTGLGFAEASALGIGSFAGETVDGTAVVVGYALLGDTNLDGTVNVTDFNALAGNFNKSGKSWINGDSNYDGVINAQDFDALAANYGQSMAIGSPALGTLVPEPCAAILLAPLALAMRRRRAM